MPRAEEEGISSSSSSSSGGPAAANSGPAAQQLDVRAPPAPVEVEEECQDDMVDNMFKRLPRKVGKEATKLYEVLLVYGCAPGEAKLEVSELYSPPRIAK